MRAREYVRPTTPEEAVRLAAEVEGARYICGGTDLVLGDETLDRLVDLRRTGLRKVEELPDGVIFGAGTTLEDLVRWQPNFGGGVIHQMAVRFATQPIRNLATIGGNIASAIPSADVPPPFIVLGARARYLDGDGQRHEVPLEDLFVHVRQTLLKERGLLLELFVPTPPPGTRSRFLDAARTPGDIVIVNAATRVTVEAGVIADVRIAVGAVHPTPLRVREAEDALRQKPLDDEGALEEAVRLVGEAVRPITDHRGTIAYRRAMSEELVRRGLKECLR